MTKPFLFQLLITILVLIYLQDVKALLCSLAPIMKNFLVLAVLFFALVVSADAQSLLYNPQRYNSSLYEPRTQPYKPQAYTPPKNNLQPIISGNAEENDDAANELSGSSQAFFLPNPEEYEVGLLYTNRDDSYSLMTGTDSIQVFRKVELPEKFKDDFARSFGGVKLRYGYNFYLVVRQLASQGWQIGQIIRYEFPSPAYLVYRKKK